MKGKLITDPNRILELVDLKKSIWHDGLNVRLSAAFLQNWQFRLVMTTLSRNLLYEYITKDKKKSSMKIFLDLL